MEAWLWEWKSENASLLSDSLVRQTTTWWWVVGQHLDICPLYLPALSLPPRNDSRITVSLHWNKVRGRKTKKFFYCLYSLWGSIGAWRIAIRVWEAIDNMEHNRSSMVLRRGDIIQMNDNSSELNSADLLLLLHFKIKKERERSYT